MSLFASGTCLTGRKHKMIEFQELPCHEDLL
jgi:hypothetical protein